MALPSSVIRVGSNRSGWSSMICSNTLKPINGLSIGKLQTRTGVLMERLGSSPPGKLIMMGNRPSNGMDSPLTAHTFNSSISSIISDSGCVTKSGKYLSFQSRLMILTCAPVSSNVFTAKPFELHSMRACFPISLATAPH